jgi:flagellin-like protein
MRNKFYKTKKLKHTMKKRGISPVVATILLIAIVIVIGLIIMLWFKNIQQEAITKFDGKNVKLVCDEVYFEASYSGGTLYLRNSGNVPIYQMKAKVYGEGFHRTETLIDEWPDMGLNQGDTYEGSINGEGNRAVLIPVLMGITKDGSRASYSCNEQYGYEVVL